MELYDRIKKSILSSTVVRSDATNLFATEQYYSDLVDSLHIKEFPLISINTIEKKTYIVESNKRFFLVFDHYLMEVMHFLNQSILDDTFADDIEAFFYRTVSEECYVQNNISAAVAFSGKYMGRLDAIKLYAEDRPEYLFVQQAFLIAHELFHFYVHKNPNQEIRGILSKERFLQRIYDYTSTKNPELAFVMADVIADKNMVEECLCDSTAVIQAIDVGLKVGKLDIIEAGVAAAIALMNQFTLSTIQDTVKFAGDISYERIQNLSNFRLLHLKAFTSLYIKELGSEEERKQYNDRVEYVHDQWIKKVHRPIMFMLVNNNELLKSQQVYMGNTEEMKKTKEILKQIFTCGP